MFWGPEEEYFIYKSHTYSFIIIINKEGRVPSSLNEENICGFYSGRS